MLWDCCFSCAFDAIVFQGVCDTILNAESAFISPIEILLIILLASFPEPRQLLSRFFQRLGMVT